jgi:hypothetical protein
MLKYSFFSAFNVTVHPIHYGMRARRGAVPRILESVFAAGGTVSRARNEGGHALAAMVQEAPIKIYARGPRGPVSYFYCSRAPRARAENLANQHCHFKSSRCCIELLGTDSCRVTVSMELPVPNSSMQHPDPDLDFDNTRMILRRWGASCIIF